MARGISTSYGTQPAFYVGDNPLLDFEGAKGAGMRTIRYCGVSS